MPKSTSYRNIAIIGIIAVMSAIILVTLCGFGLLKIKLWIICALAGSGFFAFFLGGIKSIGTWECE